MGFFGSSKEDPEIARVSALATLCSGGEGKTFQDLCNYNEDHFITERWEANEEGPWDLRFLQTNLATLSQLTDKKKLKLRWGRLFEVGSWIETKTGMFRTAGDSIEILAGDILGVLYQASLQIFCPTDRMVFEYKARAGYESAHAAASQSLPGARGAKLVQLVDEVTQELAADLRGYADSRPTYRLRLHTAESLKNLAQNAAQGLGRLRGAYKVGDRKRSLVDACVKVARRVAIQKAFKFGEIERIVDRAAAIEAIRAHVPYWLADVPAWAPDDAPSWDGQHGPGAETSQKLKQRTQWWQAQWALVRAQNQEEFRQVMNEGGVMEISQRCIVAQKSKPKQVTFADSHSKPLVVALKIKARQEVHDDARKTLAAAMEATTDMEKWRRPAGEYQLKQYEGVGKDGRPEKKWYKQEDKTNFGPESVIRTEPVVNYGKETVAASRTLGMSVDVVAHDPKYTGFALRKEKESQDAAFKFHENLKVSYPEYGREFARHVSGKLGRSSAERSFVEGVAESLLGNDEGSLRGDGE